MSKALVELGGLCEGLVEEILSRVPLEFLTALKCVSKGWCRLISYIELSVMSTPVPWILCQYMTSEYVSNKLNTQVTLVNLKHQGGGEIECVGNSPSFTLTQGFLFLGSSNGLLLCCSKLLGQIHVCNPMFKRWKSLPTFDGCFSNEFGFGLLFNGFPYHHYRVISFRFKGTGSMKRGYMDSWIFSSEIGKWREHRARLLNSSGLNYGTSDYNPFNHHNSFIPYLFREGVMHWILNHYMLIYHVENDFFKVVQLPMTRLELLVYLTFNVCLWESEGCLHYCYCHRTFFRVWKYVGIDLYEFTEEAQNCQGSWQLKHTVEIGRLKSQHPEIFGTIHAEFWDYECRGLLQPCAFDEALGILYFHIPGRIISYCFETQLLKEVWTYEMPDPMPDNFVPKTLFRLDRSFPVQLSSTDFPSKDGCLILQHK